MKAVYFLLCLALARDSAANIVRQQLRPQMDTLFVQPLVNQFQQTYQETKQQHQSESTSYESKESKEHLSFDDISDYPSLFRSGNRNWNSPIFSSFITKGDQIPYGDAIEWQGVQIAAGPRSLVKSKKDVERIFKDAYKSMQHVSEDEKRMIHKTFEEIDQTTQEEVHYNATQLLKHHGYGVEEHIVKTDDGYLLTVFRVLPKESNEILGENKRPVVLLMHGILGSADDWLLMGPKKSLAYILSDAGYDVWLGNTRGNKYARHHASKHESHPDFWQFSMDEIALHDLPAMIDFALQTSEQEKLYYVGHSQGNTIFFALAATLPEYREKVAMMYALSPMVYMTHVRSPLIKMIAPNSQFYERLHEQLGHSEFKPSKEVIHTVGGNMCEKEIGCKHVCSNINFVMSGVDTADMDFDLIPSIVAHLPAGTSTRVIKQLGQAVVSHEFRKYDYGFKINKKIYGMRQPTKYDMTEVKVPVALYYSEEDWLAHPEDVERLHKELPDVKDFYKVPEKHFNHMDFQFSKKAPEVVYKRLVESMQNN
ncbi:lipase 3-like [Vanessa atalanta]|uniref:lipase 3-like n=1 Tax=Vanessa atalanta TaxID=42275 RepID=UPI001FCDD43B|nr:lipase 3-like [Vanessa atalanta]